MTTPLNTILGYQSVDLSNYEIRGVKSGFKNAYSTGPVYDGGQYYPATSIITGCDGSFSSDATVRNLFNVTTYDLNVGDNVVVNDGTYTISGLLDTTTFGLQSYSGPNGYFPITFYTGQREYIVEPDSLNNTVTGYATFTNGSSIVEGSGTTWLTDLTSGDFIGADYYTQFFKISNIVDNTTLSLVTPFTGDSSNSTFTAKRWIIGRTKIQYVRNGITYDNVSGRWKYDSTTGSDVTTSPNLSPLIDGIDLAFTKTIVQNAPDIMDVATVNQQVFSRQTQYATYQFSLPVVPNPEASFSLWIDNVLKNRNQDYALNYTQMPIYSPPPPPAQRQVANIMFLKGLDATLNTALTETGHFPVIDSSGQVNTEILPGSEFLTIGGIDQTVYKNYVLEPNAGAFDIIDSTVNEPIVKYVMTDYSDLVNHGFSINLDGTAQQISYPAQASDSVIFQYDFGVLKPADQDHPGPDDTYEVNYMAEGVTQSQSLSITSDSTLIQTALYPIMQGSVFLQKNKNFLSEDVDYAISYLTGYIYFIDPLVSGDLIDLTYTPLSLQINNMTYSDGTSYCTAIGTQDNKLKVLNTNFQFSLFDTRYDPSMVNISRIFNLSKNIGNYSLAGMQIAKNVIQLNPLDGTNSTIGLSLTDTVLIDYTFPSVAVEYTPVVQNLLQLKQGASYFYFEGTNVSSWILPGTIMSAKVPDAATQYFFIVSNASYDVIGTKVSLESVIPTDLVNSQIALADAPINFLPVNSTASPIVSGSFTISFPSAHIVDKFRAKTLIRIINDLYQVVSATYSPSTQATSVTLNSGIISDYIDSTTLSNILYSDVPVYNAGDTEVIPENPIITLVKQPVFIMNNSGGRILNVSSDTSNLYVDGTAFPYISYLHISDMSHAIGSSNIDGLALTTYVPQWQSNKIISGQNISVYTNSNTLLNASDALSYRQDSVGNFSDSTGYTISGSGTILLDNPLQALDRYNLDYMGRRSIYDSTVAYTLKYFVQLPAKSKVVASFEYTNLDQFYIQVLDRRTFLEDVTIPRMTNEALQLNGNVGQGGQVIGDTDTQNSDGGVSGIEYKRKDAEIECRVFQDIYNYFEGRLEAYGNELDAATGLRIFNNDGYFSADEQTAAFKPVNRIFPFTDYTGMAPVEVNPLTGYFFDTHTIFAQNGYDLTNVGGNSRWTEQLKPGDFIGRYLDSQIYQIQTIVSDSSIVLDSTFQGPSTKSLRGEKYTASTGYPLYDDNGYLGPKLIGTESENFGLSNGDVFDITFDAGHGDSTYSTYIFIDPSLPYSLFLPSVSELSAGSIAEQLTANIPGLLATAETVIDGSTSYGYRTGIVLRTTDQYNNMLLGSGFAIQKLGFVNGAYAYGNRDRTDHYPEVMADSSEMRDLAKEVVDLDILLTDTTYVLDRVFTQMPYALDVLTNLVPDELGVLSQYEIPRLNTEVSSLYTLTEEPSLPTYSNDMIALAYAIDADTSATNALTYDSNIVTDYEGKDTSWAWVLDFTEQSQIVHGITSDGSNTAVSVVGSGDTTIAGQTSFVLVHPDPSFNLKILNTNLLPANGTPVVVYQNNGESVPGFWTGWDTSIPVSSNYSLINDATFTMIPTPAIDIGRDPIFSNMRVTTSPTAITFNWTSATAFDTTSFLYADYTSVSNLVGAINETPGFVASTIYDRTYTSFDLTSNVPLPTYITLDGTHLFNVSFDMTNFTYSTDTTALNIYWTTNSIPQSRVFVYGSQTLSDIVQDVNEVTSLYSSVVGAPTDYAASFDMTSGVLPFGAVTLNEGLRDCTVAYQTISDRLLDNRLNADTTRITYLTDRINYLAATREPEIMSGVENEEILRNPDGSPSDLYVWANNRFNRRQGCYSRLNQIQQQIASNQSALNINQSLI